MSYTLVLQFYEKNGQKKNDTYARKNRTKTKQCYHNDICGSKKDSFSSDVEITREIVWIKMLKREFQKRSNEINWDKLPF